MFDFSRFTFEENQVFIEEENSLEKRVIVQEEVDGTDIDNIGNVEVILWES